MNFIISLFSSHRSMNKNLLKKGFTLIEILIVILIIALLMAFIIPQLLKGPTAARDATRVSQVNTLATAIAGYRSATGKLPATECLTATSTVMTTLKSSGFISNPESLRDPSADQPNGTCKGVYGYKTIKSNSIDDNGFVVYARLENESKGNATNIPDDAGTAKEKSGKYYVQTND